MLDVFVWLLKLFDSFGLRFALWLGESGSFRLFHWVLMFSGMFAVVLASVWMLGMSACLLDVSIWLPTLFDWSTSWFTLPAPRYVSTFSPQLIPVVSVPFNMFKVSIWDNSGNLQGRRQQLRRWHGWPAVPQQHNDNEVTPVASATAVLWQQQWQRWQQRQRQSDTVASATVVQRQQQQPSRRYPILFHLRQILVDRFTGALQGMSQMCLPSLFNKTVHRIPLRSLLHYCKLFTPVIHPGTDSFPASFGLYQTSPIAGTGPGTDTTNTNLKNESSWSPHYPLNCDPRQLSRPCPTPDSYLVTPVASQHCSSTPDLCALLRSRTRTYPSVKCDPLH